MATANTRRILVTGATGQQGGAVIKALLANPPSFDFEILALTRKASSSAAQKLASDSRVKILTGDLDDVPAIFESAGGKDSIWGVFLVTMPSTEKLQPGMVNKEVAQGQAMIKGALENGVKHLIFSSVDRGGDSKSWDTPTKIPHFITKHDIEIYLRLRYSAQLEVSYTIIRPVAFMDNYRVGMIGKIFAALWAQMGQKKLQLVAIKDIGVIAAKAFEHHDSEDYKNTAIGIAGDEITQAEGNEAMWQAKSRPMVQTFWAIGYFLKWMISDVGIMFKWFEDEGYGVDIAKCRRLNPQMLDFETWLKEESKHQS